LPAQPPATGWAPLVSSRELLGLQRVVGNQAVLERLALREAASPSAESPRIQTSAAPLPQKRARD
jgi:hypothetical protein